MNEHLPYEHDLKKRLEELQLPGEDMAWADMKERLRKDDEDRPIIPPLLKGCAGYALLLLLLAASVLFIADPGNWFHHQVKQKSSLPADKNLKKQNKDKANDSLSRSSNTANKRAVATTDTEFVYKTNVPSDHLADSTGAKKPYRNGGSSLGEKDREAQPSQKINHPNIKVTHLTSQHHSKVSKPNNKRPAQIVKKTKGRLQADVTGGGSDSVNTTPQSTREIEVQQQPLSIKQNTLDTTIKTTPVKDLTVNKTPPDTVGAVVKKDSSKKNTIHFSAGVALHQLLPIAGQKSNPYNSLGRKNSWGDYVPSVYVRMYKGEKWFIQSEFRYGAPQYTKDISFGSKLDSAGNLNELSRLKKTFYHQLPVSFNHFVLPGLSVGAGVSFNKFKSAVVDREVHSFNIITQKDSVLSTTTGSVKGPDSNFVKVYVQAILEAQYSYRRFSAGVRYSFGLQPYIKFKLPGGEERQEKNSSLQLFLRYELWRSRK